MGLRFPLLLFVLLLGVSPLSAFAFARTQAIPFLLKVAGTTGRASCTATLIKPSPNTCRLITNAHCFEVPLKSLTLLGPGRESVPLDYVKIFPTAFSAKPAPTQLLKVDPRVDLAELTVPDSLGPYCTIMGVLDRNHETDYNILARRSDSHLSLGYHGNLPHAAHTQNFSWNGVRGYGKVTRAQTSLPGLRYLYRMSHIQMLAGMSGGPMLDEEFRLVGVNRRYIPHQEVTDVIPLEAVLDFIDRPSDAHVLAAVIAGEVRSSGDEGTSENGGENSGANGGENSGVGGGENSGANGGENSGANGGENQFEQDKTGVLGFLREPAEGILLEGRRLLAIGPFQIDGHDDLRVHKDSGLPYLFRESAQFADARGHLIERLAGAYRSHNQNGPSIKEKAFANVETSWREVLQGQAQGSLVIRGTSDVFSIQIHLAEYIARSVQDPWSKAHGVAISLVTFTGKRTGSDFQLRSSSGHKLVCKNQHYLKLICQHPDEELAISLSALEDGVLSFRHAQLHTTKHKRRVGQNIIYRFGTLLR